MTTIKCDQCGRDRKTKPTRGGELRLPGGWKRHADRVWCDACWGRAYILRPLTMTIVEPVDGGTKDELWDALRAAWSEATTASNWAVQTLYANDVVRRNGEAKMPPMPPIYLYGLAAEAGIGMGLDSQSRQSTFRAVEQAYRARRYEAIWLRRARIPSYTYPTPVRLHKASWSVTRDPDGGHPLVSLRLGGRRWILRLYAGNRGRSRYAMSMFDKIIEGAERGEAMIVAEQAHARQVGAGERMSKPGVGGRKITAARIKLLAWMPRKEARESAGTLVVRTGGDALWTYHVDGSDRIEHYRADTARRRIAAHKRLNERSSDDMMHERRSPAPRRRNVVETQRGRLDKHHRWIDTWTQQAAAYIANYAARCHVSEVVYDDSDKSYADMPWHRLKTCLTHALDKRGITLREPEACLATE